MYESKNVIDISSMTYAEYCDRTGWEYNAPIHHCDPEQIVEKSHRYFRPTGKSYKRRKSGFDIFVLTPLSIFYWWPVIAFVLKVCALSITAFIIAFIVSFQNI